MDDNRELVIVNDEFFSESVGPEDLDRLLSSGWRHFGKLFFRYSIAIHQNHYRLVIPLRIRLRDFALTKSLRRTLKRNTDLRASVGPAGFDHRVHDLFEVHKERFAGNKPESIHFFLDPEASRIPTAVKNLRVSSPEGELLAISYFDEAVESVSGIYAMFDPEHSRRSLGIHTLLLEIEYAKELGKSFYYLGYAYEGSSFYDYKKRFPGTEYYDWRGRWLPYPGRG